MRADLMADMSDLVEFSRDRLDEDEAAAKNAAAAHSEAWHLVQVLAHDEAHVVDTDGMPVCANTTYGPAEHIARHDPARALREAATKRAALEAYEKSVRALGPGLSRSELLAVAANATAWNDHPGYKAAEWAPA